MAAAGDVAAVVVVEEVDLIVGVVVEAAGVEALTVEGAEVAVAVAEALRTAEALEISRAGRRPSKPALPGSVAYGKYFLLTRLVVLIVIRLFTCYMGRSTKVYCRFCGYFSMVSLASICLRRFKMEEVGHVLYS